MARSHDSDWGPFPRLIPPPRVVLMELALGVLRAVETAAGQLGEHLALQIEVEEEIVDEPLQPWQQKADNYLQALHDEMCGDNGDPDSEFDAVITGPRRPHLYRVK